MTKVKRFYSGDIDIKHGGLFVTDEGDDDFVMGLEVIPASDWGGPDNLFIINQGSIYLPKDPTRRKQAFETIGSEITEEDPDYRRELILAFHAYHGFDDHEQSIVQIGKTAKIDAYDHEQFMDSFHVSAPDFQLRANASLRNFIARVFGFKCK